MAVPSGRDKRRASRVREYLSVLLPEQVTLEETRKALRISPSTIQRALRATCGLSFHELVERLRVERFLKMLAKDPDLKIEAHAPDVGWNGKSNLYASIQRATSHSLASLRDDPALLANALAGLGPERPLGTGKASEGSPAPAGARAGQARSRTIIGDSFTRPESGRGPDPA